MLAAGRLARTSGHFRNFWDLLGTLPSQRVPVPVREVEENQLELGLLLLTNCSRPLKKNMRGLFFAR